MDRVPRARGQILKNKASGLGDCMELGTENAVLQQHGRFSFWCSGKNECNIGGGFGGFGPLR